MKPLEKARKCAAKKWRSRLLARAGDIFRWRKDGVSFRGIAERLSREGMEVSHSAVASFVKARLPKPESTRKAPPRPLVPSPTSPTKPGRLVLPAIAPTKRMEPDIPVAPKKPFLDISRIPEYLRSTPRGED